MWPASARSHSASAAPVLGALSDRYGRRPVLLLGFMGLGVSFFGTAMSTTLWGLIAVRTLGGAMQANVAIANAYVADISVPEQRAKRFGLLGAMMGLGFIIGPVVGGLLGDVNLHLPFYLAGSLTLLNLLYGYFVLPESLPLAQRKAFSWRAANPATSLHQLGQLKGVGPLVGVVAFSGLAQFVLYTVWVLNNSFKFGWGPRENGWSLAVVGIVAVLVQGVLMGRLLKRFSPQKLAIMGLISSAISYTLWGAATQGWMMYAVIVFNLLGGTVSASVQSLISSAADSKSQGRTMGAVSSLNGLMAVLASASVQAQEVGKVISSTPIIQQVAVPRQVCNNEQVVTGGQKSGAGAAMGAIAGGARHVAGRAKVFANQAVRPVDVHDAARNAAVIGCLGNRGNHGAVGCVFKDRRPGIGVHSLRNTKDQRECG